MSYRHLNPIDTDRTINSLPKWIKKLMTKNPTKVILAGGAIRSIVGNEIINDWDLYPIGEANFINQQIRSSLTSLDREYTCSMSNFAYTYNLSNVDEPPTQLIYYSHNKNPFQVMESFDFTTCQASIWYSGTRWIGACSPSFYEDIAAKRLVCSKNFQSNSGSSLLRAFKFVARGYTISESTIAKLIMNIVIEQKTHIFTDKENTISSSKLSKNSLKTTKEAFLEIFKPRYGEIENNIDQGDHNESPSPLNLRTVPSPKDDHRFGARVEADDTKRKI
jgi:hypothetical protein